MKKEVKIECEGAGTLSVDLLTPTQGNLKTLATEDYEKFRLEIVEDGFSIPVAVWEDVETGKLQIIDGHQRVKTLKMMRDEGFKVPEIPIVWVKADSFEQAKRKVLGAASQYGKLSRQGLIEFLGSDITAEELLSKYSFPEMPMVEISEQLLGPKEIEDIVPLTTMVSEHERNLPAENPSQVKMVQLFFTTITHPEFMKMAMKVQDRIGTDNLTDTVFEVMRESFESQPEE
jgi:hypothetical protein